MNINKLFDHTNAIQIAAELAMNDACSLTADEQYAAMLKEEDDG